MTSDPSTRIAAEILDEVREAVLDGLRRLQVERGGENVEDGVDEFTDDEYAAIAAAALASTRKALTEADAVVASAKDLLRRGGGGSSSTLQPALADFDRARALVEVPSPPPECSRCGNAITNTAELARRFPNAPDDWCEDCCIECDEPEASPPPANEEAT